MPAVGHPPNISMLPILVNRYAICTVPALVFYSKTDFSFHIILWHNNPFNTFYSIFIKMSIF